MVGRDPPTAERPHLQRLSPIRSSTSGSRVMNLNLQLFLFEASAASPGTGAARVTQGLLVVPFADPLMWGPLPNWLPQGKYPPRCFVESLDQDSVSQVLWLLFMWPLQVSRLILSFFGLAACHHLAASARGGNHIIDMLIEVTPLLMALGAVAASATWQSFQRNLVGDAAVRATWLLGTGVCIPMLAASLMSDVEVELIYVFHPPGKLPLWLLEVQQPCKGTVIIADDKLPPKQVMLPLT